VTLTLIEHLKLIKYFAAQALMHIQSKNHKIYIDLDEIKTHTEKTLKLIKNNLNENNDSFS